MLSKTIIKKAAYVTLIFFACLVLNENFAFTQSEDVFDEVKRHVRQGNYDTAVSMLNQFVEKTQDVKGQEKNLAKAHYLLAKLYFIVSEADKKIDENIRKTFEIYPGFEQDEENMFFRERVEQIRNQLLEEGKIKEPVEIEEQEPEPFEEEEIIDNEGMIESPTVKKKKKFPLLLVLGGVAVVAVLAAILGNKKEKKPGNITSITIKFTVTFVGENLIESQNIQVDGTTVLNKTLTFTQHYNENHSWDDFQKIVHTFSVSKNLGSFTIRQEVDPYWGRVYSNEGTKNGSTVYELQIINYNYSGGIDPGVPTLSESGFGLNVSPFAHHNPGDEWYRIKEKVITINAPSPGNQNKTSKKSSQELKWESHR
jgi:hypothetical protein